MANDLMKILGTSVFKGKGMLPVMDPMRVRKVDPINFMRMNYNMPRVMRPDALLADFGCIQTSEVSKQEQEAETLRKFSKDPEAIALGSETGNGVYSTVYEGPTPDTVVKVGGDLEDGWLIYALCILNGNYGDNKLLPEILALHIDLVKGEYRAIMRRLDTQRKHKSTLWVSGKWREFSAGPLTCLEQCRGRTKCTHDTALHMWDILYKTVNIIGTDSMYHVDAHDDNWMMTPSGQLKLTDPFSGRNGMDNLYLMLDRVTTPLVTVVDTEEQEAA